MRKLQETRQDPSTFARDERALRFGAPRLACLKVVAAAVSAADSLILPRRRGSYILTPPAALPPGCRP